MGAARPRIPPSRRAIGCLIGTRTRCIRERKARRRTTSKLCSQQARIPKGSGPFCFLFNPPSCASAQTAIDGSHRRQRRQLFNNLPQDDLGTGRWSVLHLCGCSSAGRARPRHGRGHEFETRHPLHFGCVHALRCRATWCWRPGCARPLARPRAARHHVRRDARAWTQPKWIFIALVAQQAEQPPCKRQAARSIRRRGHQTCRVRLAGPGHRAFNPVTRVRIPHATPEQGTLVELTLRGWKSAATIGRRRNP